MQTASAAQAIIRCVERRDKRVRWFSATGCVVYGAEAIEVSVGGTLIGCYAPKDKLARDLVVVGLAQDGGIKRGKLAAAFGIGPERLRLICRSVEERGLSAIYGRVERRGRKSVVTPAVRRKLYKLFDGGMTVQNAFEECGEKAGLSRSTVGSVRKEWAAKQKRAPVQLVLDADPSQAESPAADQNSAEDRPLLSESDGVRAGAWGKPSSGRQVQHVGGWLLVAAVHALGLHTAIADQEKVGKGLIARLRVAIDAVILALGLGQRCVEGVRRLQTPTAAVLLRTKQAPSASWTRRVLKDYVAKTEPFWLHMTMMQIYLERARVQDTGSAVFYVDNHMRPYTGKHTLRKGWRMQDKRVRAGTSDYYVHDEDGRPVFRFNVPSHDSLTQWMRAVTTMLRAALGEQERILVAFDRAGAFPEHMAQLRDDGFEFVTYERRPYPLLSTAAFTDELVVDGETIGLFESRAKNLRNGRGRVRRIALRMPDGRQVNLLAVSKEPASRLVEIMMGRWVQENGFKHGNERWGINQLDGRKVEPYPPQTIIPNPARRRLDQALRLARHREGEARRLLARLDKEHPRRERIEQDLQEALAEQQRLEALRPTVPKKAPLEETELEGKLVRHAGDYKTLLDTIRIACANAESELAAVLATHLREPAEAKKVLANLFAAPGDVRVNGKSITVTLFPAANRNEQHAIAELLQVLNRAKLTLPADPHARILRFRSQLS